MTSLLECEVARARCAALRATDASSLRLARVTDFAPWGREAQLICWVPEVILRTQSRQQLEREILLSQRAHEMRSNSTPVRVRVVGNAVAEFVLCQLPAAVEAVREALQACSSRHVP